ncbi:MAG: keratin [Planctomycetes bacterium]|nr:keratin [Planctomycetota bacterium]
MKPHRLGLVCAMVVAFLGSARAQEPPAAQTNVLEELRRLQDRMEVMEARYAREREEYERTIAELRRDLDELKGEPARPSPEDQENELEGLLQGLGAEGAPGKEQPGFADSVGRAFQSSNPDISVNADFVGHYSSREGGELDDEFLFRHFEIGFAGAIDPYTRADIVLGIGREEGEWHTDLEEAYLTYLGLPWDLKPRGGRFRSTFGKANPQHLHALPWVEYPFIVRNYFGDEGLSGDGVGVIWLVPNPQDKYIELTYEIINNDNSLFAGEETDDFVHLLHLKNFFDLSDAATLEAGLTFATAPNDEGHGSNRTMLEGFDLTYKWRPPATGKYKSFLWQTEVLAAQADLIGGQETTWGMYTAADYQLARRWVIGSRYDYSQLPDSSSLHEHGLSAYFTFLQSEYLFWRLGYQYTDRNFLVEGDKRDHEVFMQCNFSLGTHPAHSY